MALTVTSRVIQGNETVAYMIDMNELGNKLYSVNDAIYMVRSDPTSNAVVVNGNFIRLKPGRGNLKHDNLVMLSELAKRVAAIKDKANAEKMKTEFGSVQFRGKEYHLTEAPRIQGRAGEPNCNHWYEASAVNNADNKFVVKWKLYDESIYNMNSEVEDYDDESHACDWEKPYSVTRE